MLRDTGITEFRKVFIPLSLNIKLSKSDNMSYHDPTHYRCLIGKLNFLTHTRPDLSYTIQTLTRFMHAPTIKYYNALTHVSSYFATIDGQEFFSRLLISSLYMLFLIGTGVPVWTSVVILSDSFYFLVTLQLARSQRNILVFQNPPWKLSIERLLSLLPKSHGLFSYLKSLICLTWNRNPYIATINRVYTLPKIQSFMNIPNTLKLIVISLETKSWKSWFSWPISI